MLYSVQSHYTCTIWFSSQKSARFRVASAEPWTITNCLGLIWLSIFLIDSPSDRPSKSMNSTLHRIWRCICLEIRQIVELTSIFLISLIHLVGHSMAGSTVSSSPSTSSFIFSLDLNLSNWGTTASAIMYSSGRIISP